MAQTTDKIRVVEGTQAKYDASPSTWSNDIYFATDTRRIYARGTAYGMVDEAPWYRLTPYVYADSTLSYYWFRIAKINTGNSGQFRSIEFDVHDDANYASGCRYWLNLCIYSSVNLCAALICTTQVGAANMELRLDTSGYVWIRFPNVDWTTLVRFRNVVAISNDGQDLDDTIPLYTNPSKQTTTPSNSSNTISHSGGVRLGSSSGTFTYRDAHIYAIAEEADTVDGYHADDIMTFKRQTGLNANNLRDIGVKETQGGTNMPSANAWHQVMTWGTGDSNYSFQFANKYTSGSTFYFRQKIAGNWWQWHEVIHAANYTNFTVSKTGTGASGTWGINISGSAVSLTATDTNSDLNSIRTDGRLYYAGGGNTATNKPSGVDGFGMLSMRTADGWYGQLLMSANTSAGLYWRSAPKYSGGWRKVLDSSNYTEYAASKSVATTSANGLMSSSDKQNLNLLVSNGVTGISWSGVTMSWEGLASQKGSYTIPNATTSSSGLMSASDKSTLDKGIAKYTHGGALTCHRGFSKNDNHGYPVYVLIADCTSTVNAESNGAQKGFTGIIIRKRTDGYIGDSISHVVARIGYSSWSYALKSTQGSVKPCILKNGDNYYIALRLTGSGGEVYMYGYEIGLLSTFTQVNTTDSNGTLPEGYSVYVHGTDYYGRADYAASTYSASVLANSRTLWGQSFNGSGNVSGDMSGVGSISANGEIKTSSSNAFRLSAGNYGVILRNDGSNFYFLLTNSGSASTGNFNSLRPFRIALNTGKVYMENGLQLSQPIDNSFVTESYLKGNQGEALVNSTAAAGSYVALLKGNSTNGYFTTSVHGKLFRLLYTAKSTVDAGTNDFTHGVTLLDEDGNTEFPGTVKADSFDGTASSATMAVTAITAVTLASNGRSNALTGKPSMSGLQMYEAYGTSSNYPCPYGNVLRIMGSQAYGSGELLLGWSGTNNGVAHIYYRNNRDASSTWSDWRQIAFTTDIEHYTLPAATNTVLGGVKLFSATVQSAAANAVSATSGRTYGVQKNSSGQLVVNVPWVNTTYGLASNTANGLMSYSQKQNLDILVANALTGLTWSGGKLQCESIPGNTSTVTIPNATTGANGLMSASDKQKLEALYQYIGGLERMQYHSLRIPYRMWYDASTSTNTTVTSAMLAGTQWSTVSEFATWLKNFCLHGGSVTLERSDPDGSGPRVQSCIWRYIGSATGWRLIVEYQGSFSSGAGTHNAFDDGFFIQFDPDGGTVAVRRYA